MGLRLLCVYEDLIRVVIREKPRQFVKAIKLVISEPAIRNSGDNFRSIETTETESILNLFAMDFVDYVIDTGRLGHFGECFVLC